MTYCTVPRNRLKYFVLQVKSTEIARHASPADTYHYAMMMSSIDIVTHIMNYLAVALT